MAFLPYEITSSYIKQDMLVTNRGSSHSYGVEIASVWQMLDWWRWDVNYSWFHNQYSNDYETRGYYSVSPNQRTSLRGLINLTDTVDFDIWWRYSGKNIATSTFGMLSVPSYFILDLRTAWRPMQNLELSITGQNLLQSNHLEYVAETAYLPTAIVRGVYGKISLTF